jgi:hypothetical protein
MHFHIVLTDHSLQKADSSDTGLKDKLTAIIRNGHIDLVAEEVNANDDVNTFGRELSRKLIGEDRWLSVDMTDDQRRDAGIYDQLNADHGPEYDRNTGKFYRVNRYFRHADGVRETFWLDRIAERCLELGIVEGAVLITCGYIHGDFLREKTINRGHTVTPDRYLPYDIETVHGKLKICD